MTLTDTGPLVALHNRKDADYDSCRLILPTLRPPLLTTWPCFTESMYLLGKVIGYQAQKELWRMATSGVLKLYPLSDTELEWMRVLMDKYADAPMDLADASLVAAAETLGMQTSLPSTSISTLTVWQMVRHFMLFLRKTRNYETHTGTQTRK